MTIINSSRFIYPIPVHRGIGLCNPYGIAGFLFFGLGSYMIPDARQDMIRVIPTNRVSTRGAI